MKLSVVTLYYNERQYIDQWLQCVKQIADEIIVINTGGMDITIPNANIINKAQNCDKYGKDWAQSDLRNKSIEYCSNEWVLQLDIDEVVSSRSKEVVSKYIKENKNIDAFALPTINLWYNGNVRVDGNWWPGWHYRLFKNTCRYTEGNRHLTIKDHPEVRHLKHLVRYPYTIPVYDASIIHYKYTVIPSIIDGKIRCNNKDVNNIEELEKGLKTVALKEVISRFKKGQ